MNKSNLRMIKKEATAKALATKAFELALENGLDGFVVEDVVQETGYSRRTFANYFTCKEEAVAMGAISADETEEIEALVSALPDHTSLLELLYEMTKMKLTADFLRKMRALVSLSQNYPTLQPYVLSVMRRSQTEAQGLLIDLSDGTYDELYTHLLMGAVYGAMLPLLDGSIKVLLPDESPSDELGQITFDQYLEKVFVYLRNGF
ncbi:TetR family transcriptional regulator [Paenibacillus swuensis]|uniref:TetR family transcriptional regulator n=1 Tax=Paenibacillus swuensis TaxID=1178515 RepID=A0A172THV7_9BACL|nr:TetR/AcrR family transcriptional regulator [Paenibacillus swuensis]ANE46474.1 TetR family transcriptional regulator [Paenibacillus swuensis]